jgi:hypothetical protein
MKTKLLFISSILLLSSCQKSIEGFKKNFQTTDRDYVIEQFSGGKLVKTYKFTGTLNDSKGSDGFYFYNRDTLVELSGDLIIKSTN